MRKILEERIQQRKEIQQSLFEKLNKAVLSQNVGDVKNLSEELVTNEGRLRELGQVYTDCRFID